MVGEEGGEAEGGGAGPVFGFVAGDEGAGEEGGFFGCADVVQVAFGGEVAEVEPVGVGVGEGGGDFGGGGERVRSRDQAGGAGHFAGALEALADSGGIDGCADEEELVEDLVLLGEADELFFEAVAGVFEIDGEQQIAVRSGRDLLEDLVDGGDAFAAESWVEAAAGVELPEFGERQIMDVAVAVGGAIDGGVVQAD